MDSRDLDAVMVELRMRRHDDAFMRAWLAPTWEDGTSFERRLERYSHGVASVTGIDVGVDLFEECACDPDGLGRAAVIERYAARWDEWSYASLRAQASSLASTWRESGLEPGACVAIVMSTGHAYVVAVLAAFHAGAVAAPVPPSGRTYARRRVDQLAPDFLVTLPECASWFDRELPTLPSVGRRSAQSVSHVYPRNTPALRLLSAFRSFEQEPVELSAGAIRHALLRDGLLAFGFALGERVAMPGLDALQMQPLTLLSVLRCGATWVELDERDVLEDPTLLAQAQVQLLGVTRSVRDRLLRCEPPALPVPRAWFRLLNETYDHPTWEAFRARMAAQKCTGFALMTGAASGGITLTTQHYLTETVVSVWPRAGQKWMLSQVAADGFRAWHASGVYTPLIADAKTKKDVPDETGPHILLTEHGGSWTFAGCVDDWPDARALPLEDMARVAADIPRVGGAAACIAPGRWANEAHLIIGLFVPTEHPLGNVDDVASILGDVRQQLSWEFGPAASSARIEVFALYPRWKDGLVDLDWFREQYLSGALFRRAQVPMFIKLAQLSWVFDKTYAAKRVA